MKNYLIKIPTKTYIRKYIQISHGPQLTYNTILGTLILSLLEKKDHNINMNDPDMLSRMGSFTDKIVFTSSVNTLFYKGLVLTEDKIIAINRFMEGSFVQDLHCYCNKNKLARLWRPGIDRSIRSFVEQFGIIIDEDITFDALKKSEYRHRSRFERKNKRNVPPQKL